MAIISLWRFSKARNSTAYPAINQYNKIDVPFTRKDKTDMINNPVVLIDFSAVDGAVEPCESYTYAHISGRYYFVTEWVFDRGVYEAHLEADLLATYSFLVRNSMQFIARSSVSWDGSIPDTLYPLSTKSYTTIAKPSSYFATPSKPSLIYGDFVIGVLDGNGAFGSVTYYVLNASQLSKLTKAIFDNASWLGVSTTEISSELLQSLVNPMQYIVSCMWFPFSFTYNSAYVSEANAYNIKLGWWYPGVKAAKLLQTCNTYRTSIPISTHPQYNEFGQFVNANPYSEYTLFLPGFGDIPLDGNNIAQYITDSELEEFSCNLNIDITVDFITGKAVAKDIAGAGFVETVNGRVGVPIQLSQSQADYVGAAVGAIRTASSVFSGGIGNAISNATSGIANVAESLAPQVSTVGSNGSFLDCSSSNMPALSVKRRLLPYADLPQKLGRPYCAMGKIGDMGHGFYMVANAKFTEDELNSLSTRPTVEHVEKLCALMESGFFYE